MKQLQFNPVLFDMYFSYLFIYWSCYSFNQSCLKQLLQYLQHFLQYIFLFSSIVFFLFSQICLFFLILLHSILLQLISINQETVTQLFIPLTMRLMLEGRQNILIKKVVLLDIIQKQFKSYTNQMLKGLYDLDCTTWSPQGKLFQVEYAMQAVKQGSICLGLKSNEAVVLCSLKKLPSELACYQDKIFKVDENIGIAISGLTADARVLCKYMRNQSLNYKLTYGSNQPLNRLIFKIADKSQVKTQHSSKRPYGVGLLVAGIDQDGPHLFETCPSGNYYQYFAYSIGARSQSARTYLEDHMAEFTNSTLEELILHSLSALRKSASDDGQVKPNSVQIAFVGKDKQFTILKEEQIAAYLEKHKSFKGSAEKMDVQS